MNIKLNGSATTGAASSAILIDGVLRRELLCDLETIGGACTDILDNQEIWNGTYFWNSCFEISLLFLKNMSNSLEELGKLFLLQLTKGCKYENCPNMLCAKNNTCMIIKLCSIHSSR